MSGSFQIGSITSGYRPIRKGKEYDSCFPKSVNQDRIIIQDGSVEDTLDLMKKVVWKYIDDTREISTRLTSISTRQTCQNIWEFLYHHIQYKLDERGLEQLRRPARSWVERESGIDCDCFSIFCSSILTNLGIPHKFRIAKYDSPNFQHVYVIIPNGKQEIIIDPVLSKFDYEKPYSMKKDFNMNLHGIDVAVLSGIEGNLEDVLFGLDLSGQLGAASESEQLQAIYKYLVSTRNSVSQNPTLIQHREDPQAFLKMLDYAISYWNTDKRNEALSILAMNEIDFNQKSGIGELGSAKNFFQKIGDAVKSTAQKVGTAVQAAAKAVVKYNPISIAARTGLLLAMKLNLKKMASKLKWGYGTKEQAAKAGVSSQAWNKAKTALTKIESLYADKIQGEKAALRDAILKGKAGGLNGPVHALGELGEPITISAAIAAATPLIIATIKIMKDAGLFDKNEDTSTDNLLSEAKAANGAANSNPTAVLNTQPIKATASLPGNSSSSLPNKSSQSSSSWASSYLPSEQPYNESEEVYRGESYNDPSIVDRSTTSDSSSGGSFLKNNPMILAAGLGAAGLIAYYLLKPGKKSGKGLSGPGRRKSKSRPVNSSKPKARGKKIQRVTIK